MVGCGASPITLIRLPQNWIICTVKCGPKKVAQITTILGNCTETLSINKNVDEIHEIDVFLGS